MGLRRSEAIESRFAAYVEGLASVIGHADRAGPLRDYCTGLMLPCERKSVEPMAAVTAPDERRRSISRCCILLARRLVGREGLGQGARDWCCRRSSGTGRSRPGSSTTRAFPRRGGTRSGWRGNIAANSASRTIARSRCRCRWPTTTPACRWPIGCICRKTGRTIASGGARRACRRRSRFRPSRRSRSSRSRRPARPACRAAWC